MSDVHSLDLVLRMFARKADVCASACDVEPPSLVYRDSSAKSGNTVRTCTLRLIDRDRERERKLAQTV